MTTTKIFLKSSLTPIRVSGPLTEVANTFNMGLARGATFIGAEDEDGRPFFINVDDVLMVREDDE